MDTRSVYNIEWPTELYERRGARQRLSGITVFCDFPWTDIFPGQRTMFRGGLALARYVRSKCGDEKTPAIILTQSAEREGWREHPSFYLMVVNISQYRASAGANTAAGYFAQFIDPQTAAVLDLQAISP